MALGLALALARSCAPSVAPETLLSIARAESGFDPLVIGVNSRPHQTFHAASATDAAHMARTLLAQGRNIDLGLTQINARNLSRLGLTVEEAFDPCRNLAGGARILTESYLAAARGDLPVQVALDGALSSYNTGDTRRGLRNGYVGRVYRAAAEVVPALRLQAAEGPLEPPELAPATLHAAVEPPEPAPSLDVFVRTNSAVLVWNAVPPTAARRPASISSGVSP